MQGYDEKVLAKLIKESAKQRIYWQKTATAEIVSNGVWTVIDSKFEDMRIRVALFAIFGRDIEPGESVAMIAEEYHEYGKNLIDAYQPEYAGDVGILTPFVILGSPDNRMEVQIMNFGETEADLLGVPLEYVSLIPGKSCYRSDDTNQPIYFGDNKRVMILPVRGNWDAMVKKYTGIYREKEQYIKYSEHDLTEFTKEEAKLYRQAIEFVVDHQQASVSFLQRKVKIGYSLAARFIDRMEEEGIVGPFNGKQPREVLVLTLSEETPEEAPGE